MLRAGQAPRDIAEDLNVSVCTVYYWRTLLVNGGVLKARVRTAPRHTKPRKVERNKDLPLPVVDNGFIKPPTRAQLMAGR